MATRTTVAEGDILSASTWDQSDPENPTVPTSGDEAHVIHACTHYSEYGVFNASLFIDTGGTVTATGGTQSQPQTFGDVVVNDGGVLSMSGGYFLIYSLTCNDTGYASISNFTGLHVAGAIYRYNNNASSNGNAALIAASGTLLTVDAGVYGGAAAGTINGDIGLRVTAVGTVVLHEVAGGSGSAGGTGGAGLVAAGVQSLTMTNVYGGSGGTYGGSSPGPGGNGAEITNTAEVILTAAVGGGPVAQNGGYGLVYTGPGAVTAATLQGSGPVDTLSGMFGAYITSVAPTTITVTTLIASGGGSGGSDYSGSGGGSGLFLTGPGATVNVTSAYGANGGTGSATQSGGSGGYGLVAYGATGLNLTCALVQGGNGGKGGDASEDPNNPGAGLSGGPGGTGGAGLHLPDTCGTIAIDQVFGGTGGDGGAPGSLSYSGGGGGNGGNGGTGVYAIGLAATSFTCLRSTGGIGGYGGSISPGSTSQYPGSGGRGGDGYRAGNTFAGTFVQIITPPRRDPPPLYGACGASGYGADIANGTAHGLRYIVGAQRGIFKLKADGATTVPVTTPMVLDLRDVQNGYSVVWDAEVLLQDGGSLTLLRAGLDKLTTSNYTVRIQHPNTRYYTNGVGAQPTLVYEDDYPLENVVRSGTHFGNSTYVGAYLGGGDFDYPPQDKVLTPTEYANGEMHGTMPATTCDHPAAANVLQGTTFNHGTAGLMAPVVCDQPAATDVLAGVTFAHGTEGLMPASQCDYPSEIYVLAGTVYADGGMTGSMPAAGAGEDNADPGDISMLPKRYRFTVVNNTDETLAAESVKIYLNRWKMKQPLFTKRFEYDSDRELIVNANAVIAAASASSVVQDNRTLQWEGGNFVAEITTPADATGTVKIYLDTVAEATQTHVDDAGKGREVASFSVTGPGTQKKSFKL